MKFCFLLAAYTYMVAGWSGVCFSQDTLDPRIILRRGDANNDGVVDVSDPMFLNTWLQTEAPEDAPPCMNQADANDDGRVDSLDTVYLLNWLYNGGPPPPSPGSHATKCTLVSEEKKLGCDTWPPGCEPSED